jgi:hypothetical protein
VFQSSPNLETQDGRGASAEHQRLKLIGPGAMSRAISTNC